MANLLDAAQPYVGLISKPQPLQCLPGTLPRSIAVSSLGHLDHVLGENIVPRRSGDDVVTGSGVSSATSVAELKAAAEALERYCNIAEGESRIVIASADEMSDDALDWRRFPKLSDREYADLQCPLSRFDPSVRIRWIPGFDLIHRRARYVPLAMTHVFQRLLAGEKFIAPVSTGTAAHTDLATACVSGICEVIERDATTLTWLGRLELPKVDLGTVLAGAEDDLVTAYGRYSFYDATTDLGVPTVMCLQMLDHHETAAQVLCCSTSFDSGQALRKALDECVGYSSTLGEAMSFPPSVEEFEDLRHGAAFMARPSNRNAFGFLLNSTRSSSLHTECTARSPAEQLQWLIAKVASLDMSLVMVDMTAPEVAQYGLRVVRAIVPELMPLPYVFRARYLGASRLYPYISRVRGRPFVEGDVNPDPLAFA